MKRGIISIIVFVSLVLVSCSHEKSNATLKIIYLHHSTGGVIWNGNTGSKGDKINLPLLFKEYKKEHEKDYYIKESVFPKAKPYGWNNYPYDYYNIWVKNAGEQPFKDEPTLEMLTKEYQVIIFKHCFPVSNIQEDSEIPDIDSDKKTLSNYKLQYLAIRDKLHEFSGTKFILWTGAAQVKAAVSEAEALRAREFFEWVISEWDQPDDNIYLWDLYALETEGGLYLKDEFAVSPTDSHPNKGFAGQVVKLLFNRIIDILEDDGKNTKLTGET